MRFRDIKIEKQFWIIIVFIFLVVFLLGSISLHQSDSLWKQTQNLYEHPLKVSRAISGLKTGIITLDRDMKDYLKETDREKQNIILQNLNNAQADISHRLDVLYKYYRGPKSDIQKIENNFNNLKVNADQIIRLVGAGEKNNAQELVNLNNNGFVTSQLLQGIHTIGLTAKQKANQFYQKAQNNKNTLKRQMFLLITLIFVALVGAVFLIYHRAIRVPLKKLTRATQQFSEGNYDARVNYSSENELGVLAATFNRMASAIQAQIQREDKAFRFNVTLFKREDLAEFTHNLLTELIELTGSQIGSVYLLNHVKADFILFKSIGLSRKAQTRFSAKTKEGEFGMALVNGKITRIQNIPEDTPFVFTTTSGSFRPKEIITIPIREKNRTVAMISLASLQVYSPETMLVLQDIYPSLNARFNGVLLFKRIKEQAEQLEKQNTELEIQGKELSAQSIELSRQNTELKMQKNQLDEANRLKSTFLSNMSHELRTPLNSVIALSSVLKRKLKGAIPEEEFSYIDVIERNGKQLLELINDVLDLSRIESGRIEIEQTDININELINGMITLIEPQAREKNIRLTSLIKEELPTIYSDGNKIRHILQNLIGNAVKFTEKGKVEVSAFDKDNYLHIKVSDTGIGIPPDQIPYIFDEFRQVDSSTSRKYGGTGLGLSIAKRYAHMLGGTIEVQSTPGEGSVFTLILPLEPVEIKTSKESPVLPQLVVTRKKKPAVKTAPKTSEKTILIVEDSEPAIIQLKDILNEAGFQVLTAHNGREALEQIAKTLPDAMILDLMMPEIDGFQVLEAVRANVDTAELPVLVLTAKHLEGKDMKHLKHNHIFQLLQKGDVNREQLLQLVNEMVFPEEKISQKKTKTHSNKPIKIKKADGEKPLILIVEDNIDNLLTIKSLLGDEFRTIEAYDGQDGVIKAKAHRPDLILMDIAMPVMNGFRAFDAIRKEKNLQHIPILAVTASALTANREEILHYGFDGYIPKPIDIQKFEITIQNFFTKSNS